MHRILILRPDNIGDVLLFSGALRQIRDRYPDSHLTVAVQPHVVNLLELCPYLDACIPVSRLESWDRIGGVRIPYASRFERTIRAARRKWHALRPCFDLLVYPVKSPQEWHLQIVRDLNVGRSFGITGCELNAPEGGYRDELRPEALFTDRFDVAQRDPWLHELVTTLDFLRFLGCPVATVEQIRPQLWLSERELDRLASVTAGGADVIGIFPGAAAPTRCWDPRNYGELAKLIGGNPRYAIFGGPADRETARMVEDSLREAVDGNAVINLAGKTSLRELAKSISSCRLLISMETSALHMAIAAGIPSIGIVGGGHYGRFVPWGDPEKHRFLSGELDCFHCNWNCRKGDVRCIQGVSAAAVAEAAQQLSAKRPGL